MSPSSSRPSISLMSFSSNVKEELGKINIYNKKEIVEAEILGYMLSGNTTVEDDYIYFITENEFNIERLYKLLFNLKIDYEPETRRKVYVAKVKKEELSKLKREETISDEEELKAIVRGAFLGSGSINDPNKKYHLEILLKSRDNAMYLQNIIKMFGVKTKLLESNNTIYIKEGEEISKFLALIGATKSVLSFEEIRVLRDTRNNVNRLVNCETANLNKIVNASVKQIEDIKFYNENITAHITSYLLLILITSIIIFASKICSFKN